MAFNMLTTQVRSAKPGCTQFRQPIARVHRPAPCARSTRVPAIQASNLRASRMSREAKKEFVDKLLNAKEASGKTFTQIADEIGVTNAYCAQLFYNQAQLKVSSVAALKAAVPALTDEDIDEMTRSPIRSWDPTIVQEPHVYRMTEAVHHYGEAIKAILNEEFGDGIMSAINMYATVERVTGTDGKEERVCITFNGKFLPHIEQTAADNTAKR